MRDVSPALRIHGQIYEGWTGVSVTRDIEQMAGVFQLSLRDKWAGMKSLGAVRPGLACSLSESDEPMVTGWLDSVEMSIAYEDHSITATGRDKTGDLIDCAAIHQGGSWDNQSIYAIATDLCRPFSVAVTANAPAAHETVKQFKLEESEKVFDAIERLCRIKGLLPTSTPAGALLLTSGDQATSSGASLRTGKDGNVLHAQATFNNAQRFATYIVKGQDSGLGLSDAAAATGPKGSTQDAGITRYRPLTVLAEDSVDAAACQKRAEWEASVRAGRARRLIATVQGWHHAGGLWRPLTLVDCEIPEVNLSARMLISAVTYSRNSEDGTTTELTLADPAAFAGLAMGEQDVAWGF